MIYVTGDTHTEPSRLSNKNFPEQAEMTKEDYVVILGDFGLVFAAPDESREEKYWLDWLEERPFTMLFVDGNHENFDRLDAYPVEEWHGGKIQKIRPSVIHLMRGEIYDIDGASVFTFGGAASRDISGLATEEELKANYAAGVLDSQAPDYKEKIRRLKSLKRETGSAPYRVFRETWWPQEMPSEEEMNRGLKNLEAHDSKVDFIFTHEAPSSVVAAGWPGEYKAYRFSQYLEEVRQKTQYHTWFFGHYHKNRQITDKDICVYKQVARIW